MLRGGTRAAAGDTRPVTQREESREETAEEREGERKREVCVEGSGGEEGRS